MKVRPLSVVISHSLKKKSLFCCLGGCVVTTPFAANILTPRPPYLAMRQFLNSLPGLSRSSFLSPRANPNPLKVRWILPNQLAMGRYIRSGEGAILAQAGITTILSLCDETEASIPTAVRAQFDCICYPLPDSHCTAPLQAQDVMAALNIVHSNIIYRRPLYVHCLAGMERSPTICIAYLCLYQGYGLWESLNWVKQMNPRTMPTEDQLEVVQSLIAAQSRRLDNPQPSPYQFPTR